MQYQFNPISYYPLYHYPYYGGAFGSISGTNGAIFGHQKPNSWVKSANTYSGPNFFRSSQKRSSHVVYPQYPLYNQWGGHHLANWLDQSAFLRFYNSLTASQPRWNPQFNNWSYQGYNPPLYYWPTTNYFGGQLQYQNYFWSGPQDHWGASPMAYGPQRATWSLSQQFVPATESTSQTSSTLKDTSSDVLRDYHLPAVITKRIASDIPRFPRYSIELRKSNSGGTSNGSHKASHTSIRQIASSRLFGTSMVFQTDSDPEANRTIEKYA